MQYESSSKTVLRTLLRHLAPWSVGAALLVACGATEDSDKDDALGDGDGDEVGWGDGDGDMRDPVSGDGDGDARDPVSGDGDGRFPDRGDEDDDEMSPGDGDGMDPDDEDVSSMGGMGGMGTPGQGGGADGSGGSDGSGGGSGGTPSCDAPVNLIPIMTGPSDDVGRVTDSGYYASAPGWQAFNGQAAGWLSELYESPAVLSYEFNAGPTLVSEYAIQYTNGTLTTRAPRDWTFEGWDGDSWIVLDTQSDQTSWTSGEWRSFAIGEAAAYSTYRLVVTQDNDARDDIVTVSIGQMELRDCLCDTTPHELIPEMTSSEDDFGIVTASGDFSGAAAFQAFDGTVLPWLSELWESPAWVAYEFKEGPRTVTEYSVWFTNGTVTTRAPKDFGLEGWDGDSWITLDVQTGQTGWTSGEWRTFELDEPATYSKFRLLVSEDNDGREPIVTVSIGEFDLLGHSCQN